MRMLVWEPCFEELGLEVLPVGNKLMWIIALTRFDNFMANFPLAPKEEHVSQYHKIIQLLEEATGEDLLRFRIAPDRLGLRVKTLVTNYWKTRRLVEIVEYAYFCSQVRGLIGFMKESLDDGQERDSRNQHKFGDTANQAVSLTHQIAQVTRVC
jgi:hypothetical protein